MFESNRVRIEATPAQRHRAVAKWGDRQQRRIDILEAARDRIAQGGYLALNMRDLAAGAGVSPGTLYSYFATKEELFATLYAEAIRAHTDEFGPVADAGLGLADLLREAIARYLDLYGTYGRHFTLWSAMRHDVRHDADAGPDTDAGPDPEAETGAAGFPRELIVELRTATLEHNKLLMRAIREAAARDGREVVDEKLVPSFLWSALNGLADHFVSERSALDRFPAERLIQFSAERLALAVTEPVR